MNQLNPFSFIKFIKTFLIYPLILILIGFLSLMLIAILNDNKYLAMLPALKIETQTASKDPKLISSLDFEEKELKAKEELLAVNLTKPKEELVDTSNWRTYQNKWYGFEIKYPDYFLGPKVINKQDQNDNYEKIYRFTKKTITPDRQEKYTGFDVIVYNKNVVNNIFTTKEVDIKYLLNKEEKNCKLYGSLDFKETNENDNPQTYKVTIDKKDPCYVENIFYTNERETYLYNIVPKVNDNFSLTDENSKIDLVEVNNQLSDFNQIGASLNLIKIERPKPKPKAPKPHAADKVNGKYVCAKSNDKPKWSDKNPEGHLDMECCLDPDETPNPWCSYSTKNLEKVAEMKD
jgi:hypothetical protein